MNGESQKEPLITPLGKRNLEKRLRNLDDQLDITLKNIGEAAARDPDLPENTEFKQEREKAQFQIPTEKKRIQNTLFGSHIVRLAELDGRPCDEVWIGSVVTLVYENGAKKVYTIVGHGEGSPHKDGSGGPISYDTELANTLLTRKVGDTVQFRSRSMKIVEIGRDLSFFDEE